MNDECMNPVGHPRAHRIIHKSMSRHGPHASKDRADQTNGVMTRTVAGSGVSRMQMAIVLKFDRRFWECRGEQAPEFVQARPNRTA